MQYLLSCNTSYHEVMPLSMGGMKFFAEKTAAKGILFPPPLWVTFSHSAICFISRENISSAFINEATVNSPLVRRFAQIIARFSMDNKKSCPTSLNRNQTALYFYNNSDNVAILLQKVLQNRLRNSAAWLSPQAKTNSQFIKIIDMSMICSI